MKSSITDIIQTVAVVIGISFAIWEFVLQDRIQDNARKLLVNNLIISGTNDSIIKSFLSLSRGSEMLSGKKTLNELQKYELEIIALDIYYDNWVFCYKHNLCDKTLTLEYVCNALTSYSLMEIKFNKEINRLLEEKASKRRRRNTEIEPDYAKLLSDCDKNKQSEV